MKTYIAIGPNAWGQSKKSIDEAVSNAKKNVPRSLLRPGKYEIEVAQVDGKFLGVDGMGRIHYKGKLTPKVAMRHMLVTSKKCWPA